MKRFAQPSPELRERLLSEVVYDDRLVAGYLHQRAGVSTVELYSLEDLFALLCSPCPLVDVAETAVWCRRVLRDEELAGRLEAAAARKAPHEHNRLMHLRDLVGQRLLQCRQAV